MKLNKHIDIFAALVLVSAIMISVFFGSYPTATAAESDNAEVGYEYEDGLADTGYNHRSVSFDGVPDLFDSKIRNNVSNLYLDAQDIYINIYQRYHLNVMDAYSHSVNARIDFSSSDSTVALIDSVGVITGQNNGVAQITAADRVTGTALSCTVYVGKEYSPTEPPAQRPTDEPTDPPEPTQAPTQPPTQKPTQMPTQAPTQAPTKVTETLKLNAASATVYRGNYYHVVATSNVAVSFKSSNTSVATVNGNGIVTARANGTVNITASTSTKSAVCTIKVISGTTVNLSHKTSTVNRFMTLMLRSTTSGVKWSSSNPSVATVSSKSEYGFVYGAYSGTAVITASTSSGAATCLVTVNPAQAVRFAYASPNCAAKNQNVTLIAVTDTQRTAVRFEVKVGSTIKYVNATSHTKDGDTYVWKGSISFSTAGTYSVKAYAQYNNNTTWSTAPNAETTAFVTNSTDYTTTVCANRRASDSLIKLIATFEGYYSSTYIDTYTDDPTLGYGVLVFAGETFYNNLTKTEAYAYLVQNINSAGYADAVNSYLIKNKVKYNQQQFDALVCFVYNCGTGTLEGDDELSDALLNCYKNGVRDLNYINKQNFIEKLCAYHHAGGGCVYGLLYRRVDETEMFFYGDYHADYGNYRYPIKYTCYKNSSVHT